MSARLRRGAPPDFDGLQFQCAKFLHRRTFAALRASPDFEPVACALTQPDAEREVFEQPDELEDGAGDCAGEYAVDGAGDGAGDDEGDDAFSHDEASSRLLIGSRGSISLASEATALARRRRRSESRFVEVRSDRAPARGFLPEPRFVGLGTGARVAGGGIRARARLGDVLADVAGLGAVLADVARPDAVLADVVRLGDDVLADGVGARAGDPEHVRRGGRRARARVARPARRAARRPRRAARVLAFTPAPNAAVQGALPQRSGTRGACA